MEAIVKQRVETPRKVFPPFTRPRSFFRYRWWNRSVSQETLAEIVLVLVTLTMAGGMLWGFFRALSEWQLGV